MHIYITEAISDKTLHKLARNMDERSVVALGLELNLEYSDVEKIQKEKRDAVDQIFHLLRVNYVKVIHKKYQHTMEW